MTYTLNASNASSSSKSKSRAATPRYGVIRFSQEVLLLIGLLALVFWLMAMFTYSPQDAAWSTSGAGQKPFVHNWMGRVGAWLADACYFGFGMSIWWLVLAAVQTWVTSLVRWMRGGVNKDGSPLALMPLWRRRFLFWGGLAILMIASCALEWTRLYRFENLLPGPAGGVFGYMMGFNALKWLGFAGSGLIGICLFVLGAAMVFGFSWGKLAEGLGARLDGMVQFGRERREIAKDVSVGKRAAREREEVVFDRSEGAIAAPVHQPVQIIEPVLQETSQPSARVVKERQKPLFTDHPDSKLPQVDLLDQAQQRQELVSAETLEMTSRLIEKRLKDFGVEVRVVAAMPGPVITRYEIEPATGVKGSQIVNLAKDLARSLSLVSIRVIETIPGKNFMALELPNAKRQSIRLSEVLGSQVYHDAKSLLTMGLGKDIVGNPVVADLAKMPHVLVAGTTGSGKSVGINAMILSLLYKAEARDVRLLMIDPKMLEMSVYEGIPHLLCPVVTDMKQAANGLNWCVAEMERRYKLMSKLGVRNLAGYNSKIDEAKAREESIPNPFSLTPEEPEPLQRLPHIVIVIDELADLMMVVGKKIEELIARLAQKARAAGIHLILATQRPSVDVITGLIKANIPTRIAFQVSSKIDSRTVLDQMGAETLLGMGDMLYMASGTGLPIRVHGAFVSDDEVHRVVSYLKEQGEPDYIEGILEGGSVDGEGGDDDGEGGGEKDELYDQAVEIVLKDRKASISYVQRKLRIGYNRSANLLEQMEKAGLVSSLTSSGQRDVLVPARSE
ncbi:DNA translocase FtsK 4TM domain-containing protein [Comamonas thiooxydans]|uniref:DNA translocase FtsK 4TM domain-containing protein n=1 Tax=Comamonas thiooxydans TaxID=363952 RepID=A0AA42PYM7_9BURK|nr:DNA translocase FtsK [Comamonas thiooxydans]MDH1333642.1 DNA translocase FtsK 4TM domain-containing protein [Comamonas thiooxydans]MDH1739286.1 DNA translocase FtsK 4TM domain-containing protein [Comamonas thiooxydans]MDH1785713.1 DNA translocase FtsK 4TM domain-containing protein [Comamonas thiooxydans]